MSDCLTINLYYNNGDRVNLECTNYGQTVNGKDTWTVDIDYLEYGIKTVFIWFGGVKGWQFTETAPGVIPVTVVTLVTDPTLSPDLPTYENGIRWRFPFNYTDVIQGYILSPCADFDALCCMKFQLRHYDGTYTIVEPELVVPNREWRGKPVYSIQVIDRIGLPARPFYLWYGSSWRLTVTTEGINGSTVSGPGVVDREYWPATAGNGNCPVYSEGYKYNAFFYNRS